jgi:hypothetical protein
MAELLLLDLSSESDSDDQSETEMLAYVALRAKSIKRAHMKERRTDGEFTNYFRSNREQFSEVHSMIESEIYSPPSV